MNPFDRPLAGSLKKCISRSIKKCREQYIEADEFQNGSMKLAIVLQVLRKSIFIPTIN
jgi:hypothetical protein